MKLVGNTVIVTGGARGIGFGMADHLMAHGDNVAITDRRTQLGEKAAKELSAKHDTEAFFLLNVM